MVYCLFSYSQWLLRLRMKCLNFTTVKFELATTVIRIAQITSPFVPTAPKMNNSSKAVVRKIKALSMKPTSSQYTANIYISLRLQYN